MDKISCELRFSGLIAFVAPIGFRKSRKADRVDVLLLDVANSTFKGLPVHTPTLEIQEGAIKSGPPSDTNLPAGFQRKFAASRVWVLSNQRVAFEHPAGARKRGVRGVRNAAKITLPTGSYWRDLKWVPDLETVRGGKGKGRFKESSGRADRRTTADFPLESGKLEARSPMVPGFETVECGFVPPVVSVSTPTHQQILTDRVVFVTDPATSLAIVLTPRGTGGQPRRIELLPMANSNPIPIEVCNENTTGAIAVNDSTHFAAFYDLIDPKLKRAQRLIPKPIGVVVRTAQDPPAFCPPAFLFRRR